MLEQMLDICNYATPPRYAWLPSFPKFPCLCASEAVVKALGLEPSVMSQAITTGVPIEASEKYALKYEIPGNAQKLVPHQLGQIESFQMHCDTRYQTQHTTKPCDTSSMN